MADDEVLRRIDRCLERIDQHMERGNRLFEENRTFMRDLALRHERATNAAVETLQRLTRQIDGNTREIRERRHEFVEETRAGRAALFRILDRLDNGGATAGA